MSQPISSVIVVNWEEAEHTVRCLNSLAGAGGPPAETILVDNGSADGSIERITRRFPAVRVVRMDRNVGFAAAANAGAQNSEADYLVFLNNDTYVEHGWLSALVSCAERRQAVSVGAKLLSWDGHRIDFAGGDINALGHGFQIDLGVVHNPDAYTETRTAFGCGAAMLVRRDWFERLGGFDAGYFSFFEDVDFGWRCWLAGGEVWFAPAATVRHRGHQTARRLPGVSRKALLERNALFNLYKNLESTNVGPALAAATTALFRRTGALAVVGSEKVFSGAPTDSSGFGEGTLAGQAAVEDFLRRLPELEVKREVVQRMRSRSDSEIFECWDGDVRRPNLLDPTYVAGQELALSHLWPSLNRKPGKRKVLVIAHEAIGDTMTGPAIRSFELARALVNAGDFDLTLASPGVRPSDEGDVRLRGYRRDTSESIVPLLNACDAVFAFGYLAHELPELADLDKPVALDVYDPFTFENLEIHGAEKMVTQSAADDVNSALLINQFLSADYYVCSDSRQRDFYLGALAAAGRLNPLTRAQDPSFRRLIDVVPFGTSELAVPSREEARSALSLTEDDFVLLWNGGLWEWLDADTLLEAVARAGEDLPSLRLLIPVYQRDRPELRDALVKQERVMQFVRDDIRLSRTVRFVPWSTYEERGGLLGAADLAICLHRTTLESRFALRSRIADCLSAGLPFIATTGGPWDELVRTIDSGMLVPPGDPASVITAIRRLAVDPQCRSNIGERLREAGQGLKWEKVVGPLAQFLERGEPAADRRTRADRLRLRQRSPAKDIHTKLYRLPQRALETLAAGGPESLKREIANYLRWRLGQGQF